MIKTNVERKSIQLHWFNFKMCEYKARLLAGAAVVLHALLMLMPVSAFATAGDGQEIGVPQAMEAKVKGCFGAALSPDGDHFYTMHEKFLTQYRITPFKKVGSIAIDREPFKERQDDRCRVLITNDKSKLIFVYSKTMFLLDAKTGQILNKLERKNGTMIAAILNENELVTLNEVSSQDEYYLYLAIWDANTLQLKRENRDLVKGFDHFSGDPLTYMSSILGKIYLVNTRHVAVLNGKTYAHELDILKIYGTEPRASKNFQKFFVQSATDVDVTDHLNGKRTTYDVRGGNVLVFDQESRESRVEKLSSISRDEFPFFIAYPFRTNFSYGNGYAMWKNGRSFDVLMNLNTGKIVQFNQYESGEAILIGRDTHFQLTPGAKKYLMMKNSEGKIVPINDATFTKYHRTEN